MIRVMPIVVASKLRKNGLIDQLVDFVRETGLLVDVLTTIVKEHKLTVEFLYWIILQYDSTAVRKTKKKMIEHFAKLNMPEVDQDLRDDGPIYVPDCDARTADGNVQVVDYERSGRRTRKMIRKMHKTWLKGARLLRRKMLSKEIEVELKHCLHDNDIKD